MHTEAPPDEGHVVRSRHEGHLIGELLPVVVEGPREVRGPGQFASEGPLESRKASDLFFAGMSGMFLSKD